MAFIRPFKPEDSEDAKYIVSTIFFFLRFYRDANDGNSKNPQQKCRATLPPSISCSETGTRMAPYLWTLQFTHLFPQNCFVLDDGAGNGHVVGYVIGVPDVWAFADAYPRYVEEVLRSEQGSRDVPAPKQLEKAEPWNLPPSSSSSGDSNPAGGAAVNPEAMAQSAYKVEWLVLDGVEGKAELVRTYRAMLHIDILPEYQGKGWGRKMIERFVESVKTVVAESEGKLDYGKGIQLGVAGENTKVVAFYEKLGFRVYPGGEKEGNVWMVRDL